MLQPLSSLTRRASSAAGMHLATSLIKSWYAGNAAAVKGLVRQCTGGYAKDILRKVWGIRKTTGGLELPEQAALDNPLLAVMWARFQESCRLFHASGDPTMTHMPLVLISWLCASAAQHFA